MAPRSRRPRAPDAPHPPPEMSRGPGGGDQGPARRDAAEASPTANLQVTGHEEGSAQRARPTPVRSGQQRASDNRDPWWWSNAMAAVRVLAATGHEFQAFDIVDRYGVAEPDHPNRWGALLHCAARDGLIRAVGAAPSRRPSVAGSLTRTWRGVPGLIPPARRPSERDVAEEQPLPGVPAPDFGDTPVPPDGEA